MNTYPFQPAPLTCLQYGARSLYLSMFLLRRLGISRRTVVSSARNVVKLTEGISEFGNFGPLKGIAIILGQFIETIQVATI